MRWRRDEFDAGELRSAVRDIVESARFDDWFLEAPDEVLVAVAAPLEVLTFHYYLDPPKDRHLLRAARVAAQSVADRLEECPADMAVAFSALGDVVGR